MRLIGTGRLVTGGAAVRSHWSVHHVLFLLALLTLALAWFQKSPCLPTSGYEGVVQLNWSGYRHADMCYSDIIPLYQEERLDDPNTFPYKTSWTDSKATPSQRVRYMEYPVLTGLFQWLNARAAQQYIALAQSAGLPTGITVVVYFEFVAASLAIAWLVVVWAAMRIAARRIWDAALVAVSPLVIVHAFTNFDALAVAFATGGMLAWSRRRAVLAGVLLGLGGAAKLYPLFLIGPLLLLCWRAGELQTGLKTTAAATVAWVAGNAPIALVYPAGWSEFFRFNAARGANPESLYNAISYFTGWKGFDSWSVGNQVPLVLNTVSVVLFAVACVGISWIVMSAHRRPRLPQVCLMFVSAFLLTNKVWSPQYSLWLIPLAVLALPRWRLLLAWMILDALAWVPTMLFYRGVETGGVSEGYFLGVVVLRDLAVLGLCLVVIRDICRPERDVVRRFGRDDPCGGVLEEAEDRVVFGRERLLSPAGRGA